MKSIKCIFTGEDFTVSEYEQHLYERFELPFPLLSPTERQRRLLAFHNGRTLFERKCNLTDLDILSTFPSDSRFPVYDRDMWYGSDWDPLSYGVEFKKKDDFFEILYSLWVSVPRPSMVGYDMLNTESGQNLWSVRNSNYIFDSHQVDNSYYSVGIVNCSDCCDCYNLTNSHSCYECTDCHDCNNLKWSSHSINCEDSLFLFNCKDCKNCLYCVNLEGKEYYIYNKEVTKEAYEKAVQDLQLHSRIMFEDAKNRFFKFIEAHPIPHVFSDNPNSTSGNYLRLSNDVYNSFETSNSKNLYNCVNVSDSKDCIDGCFFGFGLTNSAQFVSVGLNANSIFNSVACYNNVSDLSYCAYCENSSFLLGCVGLRGMEYCIFNKQYTKEKYFKLSEKIIKLLKKKNFWGEFLPPIFSDYAYNHSLANDFLPLSSAQCDFMGYRWDRDNLKNEALTDINNKETSKLFSETPVSLEKLEGDLMNKTFICEISGRPFKYFDEEVDYYIEHNILPPSRSFNIRHWERISRICRSNMYDRTINGKEISTSFPENWIQPVLERSDWCKEVEKNSV